MTTRAVRDPATGCPTGISRMKAHQKPIARAADPAALVSSGKLRAQAQYPAYARLAA